MSNKIVIIKDKISEITFVYLIPVTVCPKINNIGIKKIPCLAIAAIEALIDLPVV